MGIAFTIPAMVIAGAMLYYHSLMAQRYLTDEGARYAQILADQILGASQRFLRLGSIDAVQEMIEETGSTRSVIEIALISDRRIIASNRHDWIGAGDDVIPEPAYPAVAEAARSSFQAQHRLLDDGKHLILVSPLLVQGANPILSNSRGMLYLKIDQERKLYEIYSAILRRGLVSALGILIISLFLLFWVRANLARPILAVAAFLRGFAAGNAQAAPPVRGTKEVAQLVEDVRRVVRDLMDKQSALLASEERHRLLLEGAYDAILTADPASGRILEVNGTFCRLFGYTPEEGRSLDLKDLHAPENRRDLMRSYEEAVALGQRDFHDIPCVTKQGRRFFVDIRGGAISLPNRIVSEWIFRDTTERRLVEEKLRQAQKMESVATLSGAIAHDFNNLLTGIMGYTRLVLNRLKPEDPNRRHLETIERSSRRAAELTSQLLSFSRRAASRLRPGDLNEVLKKTIDLLRAGMPKEIQLEVSLADGLWPTAVDQEQIEHALIQLCTNAREAMPDGGHLTIATANRSVTEQECTGTLDARPGRFVTLTVEDTGQGIDPEIKSRIFEPFFTTKKNRKGAGLGLATAYGTIRGHEGWIEMTSSPGRGARFVIHLPYHDAAAEAERPLPGSAEDLIVRLPLPGAALPIPGSSAPRGLPPAARRPAPAAPEGSRRTVLAVDDESTVLALVKDILEMQGFDVLTARNGEEALRLYRERSGAIDLVLLDLTMPLMGGLECFREMQKIDPAVRVVVASGYSSESTANEILSFGALGYVPKPYDIEVLARVVRRAMEDRPKVVATPSRN
jgi:PAS domain S-box-containing protein